MNMEIQNYIDQLENESDRAICNELNRIIHSHLEFTESKIWHAHPVWFIDGNPIVGFSKQKAGIRLMFWSGADFEEDRLNIRGEKFKDASLFFNDLNEINEEEIKNWLKKAELIQWDYKNLVKRKGKLERLK